MPEGSVSFGLALPGVSRIETGRGSDPRRRLLGAAGVSVLLHGIVVGALLLGLSHRARVVEASDTPAIVELVMSPPGGRADAPATAQPSADAPAQPAPPPAETAEAEKAQSTPTPQKEAEAQPPLAADQPAPEPVPPAPVSVAEPAATDATTQAPLQPTPDAMPPPQASAPAPAEAPPAAQTPPAEPAPTQTAAPASPTTAPPAPEQPPAPPREQQAPQFSLGSIASDTNALVTGDLMVPPSVDPKFHNRKPSYPRESALRSEHGAVLLQIHVSPEGLVSGVDVAKSSGFRLLDDAARDAVLTWHFLPAVKNGQPVPFDMPLRIVFDLF